MDHTPSTHEDRQPKRHIKDPREEFSMMRLMFLLLLLGATLYFGIKHLF